MKFLRLYFLRKLVNSAFLFVFPRLGTISPWASKAQNILDNTFQGVIDRVERCRVFLFDLNERNENLSSQDVRLVERVFDSKQGL